MSSGIPTVVNVKDSTWGARGDGATNDATAISAAISSLSATGGTVYFPPGVYLCNSASRIPVPAAVRLVGAGQQASTIKTTANNGIFNLSGSGNSTHNDRGGISDLSIWGNYSTTGALVVANYISNYKFDRVQFAWHNDTALSMAEAWDTYFHSCDFHQVGGPTWKTQASVRLLATATDMTNEIYFVQCRWEGFPGNALFLDSNGQSNAPYGVWLKQCKFESARATGQSFIECTNDVVDFHLDDIYLALDIGSTGMGSAALIAHIAAHNMLIENVHAYLAVACGSVIASWPGPQGHAIRNVFVAGSVKPASGIINFAGGNPVMRVENIQYQDGTTTGIYGGTPGSNIILVDHGSPQPVTLTFGSTVNTDASRSNYFRFTTTSNFILANPTNLTDGQQITWEILQGVSTGRMTVGSMFAFGATVPSATLSTISGKRDLLTAIYNSGTNKLYVTNLVKGY